MRLEEEKVIAGYHADLAGEALGFNLIAFIHITLATHSPDNSKKFRDWSTGSTISRRPIR